MAPLVVLELVVELLDLLLEQRVAALKVGKLATQVGELRAETLHLFLCVSGNQTKLHDVRDLSPLLHVLARRLRLNLLHLETIPRLHVVARCIRAL